ncbi:transcription-repair coupling factor [bacterium]|nr:transcription-repair coupling factor [bacterium]
MKHVIDQIAQLPAFEELLTTLAASNQDQSLALMRSARLPVLTALHQATGKPVLLVTQKTDRALLLTDELGIWSPDALKLYFPEPTSLFYENLDWGDSTRRERLLTLTTLASAQIPGKFKPEKPPIAIAPTRAIMSRTLPKRDFVKHTRPIKVGQIINMTTLIEHWVQIGYQPETTVAAPGQFARRGGILDIWPPAYEHPARIELFGDEIESIRQFSALTQRTADKMDQVLIAPAREFIVPPTWDPVETPPSEFHIPLIHPHAGSIFEYLSSDSLILFDDWPAFLERVEAVEEKAVNLRNDYLEENRISADYPIPYLTLPEILDSLSMFQTIQLGPSSSQADSDLAFSFSTNPRFGGKLKDFITHVQETSAGGEENIVISRQAARLSDIWDEQTLSGQLKPPTFIPGSLTDGWRLTPSGKPATNLLTDGEIFGWRRPQPRARLRPQVPPPEEKYPEIEYNALVVHIDHGIGYFKGLVEREIDGFTMEYFCIEYAEGDQLYVPIHQADRISRYIGARSHVPSISRLSSPEWKRIKSKVQKAVEHVAEDLLELYAQRHVSKGFAFDVDTPWQKEMEASFPYIETEDQLSVLDEVKHDMEKPIPMDRLICGDVGYGKTEIALRAAFKAVMSGKQVAILVPTTILAQQHYRTFRQRLAAYPVKVEMLSRFRTPAEQRKIVFDLAKGNLDIVIGTHRLVQPDIMFKDLGMVIIDEEQRFGVTHKEALKKLRTEVDVLTLTATPIPRTLYMALTGIRDISTINTPPEERLPIVTHVGHYEPQLVRQAIVRELERGGQVFFVHNRVQTIESFKTQINKLVPEAQIGIAHGQMAEKELAKQMRRFTNGEIDILLSTSIIESGLDIPNANTLIIDRADTFGLAQLYQLRGRVGRGASRGYAYFFKHPTKSATEEGGLRLETLAENTQLGAGYSIAMRDLEIRGTGDFLGTRQHGHIAAVGLHLYTRLLSQAVNYIKKSGALKPDALPISAVTYHPIISIDLPLEVSIPEEYIPDKDLRLKLYRRMADAHSLKEIDVLREEFADRFGTIPQALENLFYQLQIRTLAELAGVSSIGIENDKITIRFPSLPESAPPRNYPRLDTDISTGKNTIWFALQSEPSWEEKLQRTLTTLAEFNN